MTSLVLGSLASVAWVAAFSYGVRSGSLYPALGSLALMIVVAALAFSRDVRAMFAVSRQTLAHVAIGLVVGAITLALTHALFPVVGGLYPPASGEVRRLYDVAAVTPTALAAVVIVIVAEEVLWRGVIPRALERTMAGVPVILSVFMATVLYTSAQLGVGSGLLAIAALSLGGLWALQAAFTRTLYMSLAAHAVWTLGVLGFWPLF